MSKKAKKKAAPARAAAKAAKAANAAKVKKQAPKKTSTAKVRMSPAAQSVLPVAPLNGNGNGNGNGKANANGYAQRFDRAPYEVPLMDLAEAIALATELLEAKPAKPTPVIAEEASQMAKALARAKTIQGKTEQQPVDARPFDLAMDRAWATAVRRIQDHAELPVERHADARDATKVYAIVQDLSILKLNYLAEFAQIGGRLDSLKREGLLDDACKFAGSAFIDEVLHCHAEYGRALGVMDEAAARAQNEKARAEQPTADRGEARLALIEVIREYAFQVLALARAGRTETWKLVESSLEPLAALRLRQARELRAQPQIVKPDPHPPLGHTANPNR